MSELTASERKIISELLNLAANRFSNHGCNDFDLKACGLTQAEADELSRSYHEWNGDQQEHVDGPRNLYGCDFALMWYFAARILDTANEGE